VNACTIVYKKSHNSRVSSEVKGQKCEWTSECVQYSEVCERVREWLHSGQWLSSSTLYK
jgi:dihydroneopterin aldolase